MSVLSEQQAQHAQRRTQHRQQRRQHRLASGPSGPVAKTNVPESSTAPSNTGTNPVVTVLFPKRRTSSSLVGRDPATL